MVEARSDELRPTARMVILHKIGGALPMVWRGRTLEEMAKFCQEQGQWQKMQKGYSGLMSIDPDGVLTVKVPRRWLKKYADALPLEERYRDRNAQNQLEFIARLKKSWP